MTMQEILDNAGVDYFAYSGRAMYGKKCLAIQIKHSGHHNPLLQLISHLIDEAAEEGEANVLADALNYAQTDSLGLDIVLYFPRIWLD